MKVAVVCLLHRFEEALELVADRHGEGLGTNASTRKSHHELLLPDRSG
jgi:hypothetical protein